jgi:hypothetical protein
MRKSYRSKKQFGGGWYTGLNLFIQSSEPVDAHTFTECTKLNYAKLKAKGVEYPEVEFVIADARNQKWSQSETQVALNDAWAQLAEPEGGIGPISEEDYPRQFSRKGKVYHFGYTFKYAGKEYAEFLFEAAKICFSDADMIAVTLLPESYDEAGFPGDEKDFLKHISKTIKDKWNVTVKDLTNTPLAIAIDDIEEMVAGLVEKDFEELRGAAESNKEKLIEFFTNKYKDELAKQYITLNAKDLDNQLDGLQIELSRRPIWDAREKAGIDEMRKWEDTMVWTNTKAKKAPAKKLPARPAAAAASAKPKSPAKAAAPAAVAKPKSPAKATPSTSSTSVGQCQCLTQNGKGPQCSRNAKAPTRFCGQHKECKFSL